MFYENPKCEVCGKSYIPLVQVTNSELNDSLPVWKLPDDCEKCNT